MATPASMCLRGLQMLGGRHLGGTLTASENTAYLGVLNSMLDAWSIERLMCYQIVQESQALTASVGSLTIGDGGTFDTTRPTKIVDPCFTRDSNNIDYPLTLVDARGYGAIRDKTSDGAYPEYLFYDSAFVAGLATIYLWPEPISGLTLYINSWKQLQQFLSMNDEMVLPPGYQLAIESNFAVHAAAGYRPVPLETAMIARESKAAIKRINAPSGVLRLDAGVVGTVSRSHIESDT